MRTPSTLETLSNARTPAERAAATTLAEGRNWAPASIAKYLGSALRTAQVQAAPAGKAKTAKRAGKTRIANPAKGPQAGDVIGGFTLIEELTSKAPAAPRPQLHSQLNVLLTREGSATVPATLHYGDARDKRNGQKGQVIDFSVTSAVGNATGTFKPEVLHGIAAGTRKRTIEIGGAVRFMATA